MKTFLFDIPRRLRIKSNELDVKAFLNNKAWVVFNDEDVKQVLIFMDDGKLIISTSGVVSYNTWKYIPANRSIIFSSDKEGRMYHPLFYDNKILVLQLDGTDEKLFMVEESVSNSLPMRSLSDIEKYFAALELYKSIGHQIVDSPSIEDKVEPIREIRKTQGQATVDAVPGLVTDDSDRALFQDSIAVEFGGHSFYFAGGRDNYYVDENGIYAFDSCIEIEDGLIIQNRSGFVFFYNGSFDNAVTYNDNPQIYNFYYGNTLEGILIGQKAHPYLFYNSLKSNWEKCRVIEFYPESGRFVIELNSTHQILKCFTDKKQKMVSVLNYWDSKK